MGLKLDSIVDSINKKQKEEILTKGLSEFSYTRIPFTSPRMNYCTFGGLPIGKITEFYGEEHGGKTTSALDIVANYQHMEEARDVLYVDAENTLDVEWAKKIGVDIDNMYILQPKSQSAEEIFQILFEAVDTGEVGLWVLDSIGALMSQQAWDKELTEKTYAGISKPLTEFGQKIVQKMHQTNSTGIAINQIRDNLNSTWGGTTTPGGRAWKHFCAVRLEFRRGSFIDEKGNALTRGAENPAGNIVMMSMTKNKTAPPTRRTGFYTLNYLTGIDYLKDLVDVAIKYGIIDKRGAWFTIIDVNDGEILLDKIHGQPAVYDALENDLNLLKQVEYMVDGKMQEKD